jgi:hypothetical protein
MPSLWPKRQTVRKQSVVRMVAWDIALTLERSVQAARPAQRLRIEYQWSTPDVWFRSAGIQSSLREARS